jgi:hypothetical protein
MTLRDPINSARTTAQAVAAVTFQFVRVGLAGAAAVISVGRFGFAGSARRACSTSGRSS